ncbi:MAG: pantetheine-phosphate adenylyltransferase [Flavobacteriaceae bacterium]|jgi:pantetheine-phosphate adenylyltransferase|nr:pantetheine-phosphate adenylyltransferase [Flavobacteriaceae bacterium]MDG1790718.1 pantetheine-phosphate adenylyltransferase [Flavobacteriaceae bacterium]MDG2447885.1 pantetheine-phosphate adenylyltransferase [Flavobacteriaceae bacterium]|tara:strand:- start:148 stop:600 length:453 start_codon:yes stop_codon:yes gene_type:complete
MKKAVFPGSFDPITLGHVDLIYRGLEIFDEIVIAIGVNADKKQLFSLEDKIRQIENTFKEEPRVKVESYKGMTIDFCKSVNSKYILRGLRNSSDFNYEQSIAQTNSSLSSIDSVFLITSPQLAFISSTIVRDLIKNGGDYKSLVPESVMY